MELQLYRIYLTGMVSLKRDVLTRTDTHGITGSKTTAPQEGFHRDARTNVLKEYECHIFRPCTAVTNQLDECARQRCIETAETLFIPESNFMPEDIINGANDITKVVP